VVEYRVGRSQGNADAMSRCIQPWACHCNNFDDMEPLRSGPCKKCLGAEKQVRKDRPVEWRVSSQTDTIKSESSSSQECLNETRVLGSVGPANGEVSNVGPSNCTGCEGPVGQPDHGSTRLTELVTTK
jgi:hypothetical protein